MTDDNEGLPEHRLYGAEHIVRILMRRDNLTREEALLQLQEARDAVKNGECDPEEACYEYLELEPDFAMALI